jgi:repressor LexA
LISYSRFETLLENAEVTAYQVSKATGIPASTFTDWKNGRSKPKTEKLLKLAQFFGISLEALLANLTEQEPED